jgi:electron transfer flavoprotein beta subunit
MGLRILVPIKHAIDPESLEFRESEGGIKFERMYRRINECDRYAVQEAVRLKEQYGGEVVIVTVGPEVRK